MFVIFVKLLQYTTIASILMLLFADVSATVKDIPVTGNVRKASIKQIVIHATGGPDCNPAQRFQSGDLDSIVAHFLRNKKHISIHYIIDRNGDLVRMVPESQVAYHVRSHNMNSIGIELINHGDGQDPFPEPQIVTLITLLRDMLMRYRLTVSDLKSHSELDNSYLTCRKIKIKRKSDPGAAFPWQRLMRELTQNTVDSTVAQYNAKIDALQKLLRQWTQQEHRVRTHLSAVLNDQRDAEIALNWNKQTSYNTQTIALENEQRDLRMASIQETIDQLKQRETELSLEIQGFIQVKMNAKTVLRQLRIQVHDALTKNKKQFGF
ncbi:N-acetylmuramoyl-L-alanine amidase [Chromatium okenii]|uniref:N-acetylmuramoyl-L-alanine amidase n=1 Tax=Chromatium okenii TaxID=61644 RepID=A0A2S7XNX5_9GAMM|nr:N-acetylmuramoyl-L-alanine amidase [Chromatium okenii]PQJ95138.1 hypothetical protein CXB77_12625 [Chromatium okenii]